jgi:NNP family nitrate/nitrite transporter-like MFS transporter
VYCIGLCTNAAGFIISRLFIGFSLATFVACQFWCTSMFNTKVVGTANALAAGWVSDTAGA